MTNLISIYLNLCLAFAVVAGTDWAEWRGPARDGISTEKNLPAKVSPTGENLAWKAPYGGRSAPIVMGDRVYLQNIAGKGETEQERVMCFNADTGKLLWYVNTYGEGVTPSPVFGNGLVFNSSGFPTPFGGKTVKAAIRAFRLGGSDSGADLTKSNLVWEQTQNVPMLPSLLLADNLLYSITESGQLQCLDPADGKVIYKQKLPGQYSASPLYADGRIYITSDTCTTTVLQPGREFKQLGTNELNERTQASMAPANGCLFIRTEKNLYCIRP